MSETTADGRPGRLVPVDEAVGAVLAHDITEIRPGEYKGAAFKKGHTVQADDIPHLKRLGKMHLYVLDLPDFMMHEDEAVLVLAEALAGPGVEYDPHPSEGKINLTAARKGLLKIDVAALTAFNMVDGIMCAARHTNTVVEKGEILAGTRAIPLVIERSAVEEAAAATGPEGVVSVKELSRLTAGLVVTGNEIFQGLIEDRSAPTIIPKLDEFGCRVLRTVYAPDRPEAIAENIRSLVDEGARLVVATGGMSVDPDDVTRLGAAAAGATNMVYGSSVLPGAMLMYAELGDAAVLGVPACAIYHDRTIFDLVLPRVLAGERLTRRDMAALSHGGLCLGCRVCRYPVCPFGKGGEDPR